MSTKAKDNIKITCAVAAVLFSLGTQFYSSVFGSGKEAQRLANVEERITMLERQREEDLTRITDDLRYIRSRVDVLIDKAR